MKITVNRRELAEAYGIAVSATSTKNVMPILKSVKLVAVSGSESVTLTGTNTEVGIHVSVPATIAKPGQCLLPSRVAQILRESVGDEIVIEIKKEFVGIYGQSGEWKFQTEEPDQFPNVATPSGMPDVSVPGKWLENAINRTQYACDSSSTRFAMGGVLFDAKTAGKLSLVATDGRRMLIVSATTDSSAIPYSVIVPQIASQLIAKSIRGAESAEMWLSEKDIFVRCGSAVVYSRLIEGRFPDYSLIVPDDGSITRTCSSVAGSLLSTIRQSMIVTNESSIGVLFKFDSVMGEMCIVSSAAEVGSSVVTMPMQIDGELITVRFEPKYAAEFLARLDSSDPVQIRLVDKDSASIWSSGNENLCVLMPLMDE